MAPAAAGPAAVATPAAPEAAGPRVGECVWGRPTHSPPYTFPQPRGNLERGNAVSTSGPETWSGARLAAARGREEEGGREDVSALVPSP